MPDATPYDCTQCGACCQCFPIFATRKDAEREPLVKIETRWVDNQFKKVDRSYRLYPLPFLSACPFLKEDKLCRIYKTRPDVCRQFEPGSVQCIEARERLKIQEAVK